MQKSDAKFACFPRIQNKLAQKGSHKWLPLIITALAASSAADALCDTPPSDPVLNLLLEKGMITEGEAAKVQAQVDAYHTNALPFLPADKWKINKNLKNIELFGDVRLRYETRSTEDPAGGSIDLERLRYAVRFGLRGEAFDDFYYGLRLETSTNPRSPWGTLGQTSGTSSTGQYLVPFGKSAGTVALGQIYIGWHPEDWMDVTLGKMPNYLYTTPMVWDNDLNPEGAFERFKFRVGEADFFANFGQFLYTDTNPTDYPQDYFLGNSIATSGLPFMLAWQLGLNYHLTSRINFKLAPVLYQYTAYNTGTQPGNVAPPAGPDFSGAFVGQGQTSGPGGAAYYNLVTGSEGHGFDGFYANQTGINDLLVLEFPFELDIKLDKFNVRLFGDYAQNLQGADRANAAYTAAHSFYFSLGGPGQGFIQQIPSPQTHDVNAYQFGLGIGSTNFEAGPTQGVVYGTSDSRHAWELRTYWQHVEQYALDPNLIDSDFFEGRANMEGIYTALAYAFSGNVIGTVRYGYAQRINNNLGTGGSNQDMPWMNPVNSYNLFQADVTFRF